MLSRALVRTWRVPRRALSTAAVPLDQTDVAPKVMNFINGKFESSTTKKWIPLLSPATNKLVCWVPESTPDELRRAEEGALAAFKKWRDVPIQQRQVRAPLQYLLHRRRFRPRHVTPLFPSSQRVMFRLQQLIREATEELAVSITTEQGKTLSDARGDIFRGLEVVEGCSAIGHLSMGETQGGLARGLDTYR